MIAVSWSEARKLGFATYFTGKECSRGHISERRTDNADCVMCARERMSAWMRLNPDKANEHTANWARNNPERVRERQRLWHEANPTAQAKKSLRYRERHPDKVREATRKYVKDNPDIFRAANARRRARKRNAAGSHTAAEANAMLEDQNYTCIMCMCDLRENPKHFDHIIPLSRGGSNFIDNMQWLCAACNLRKRNKLPSELSQRAEVPV
jgi:5-methylcytosine-specific restriction endonuclease McrA